jgi:hypothetical protein
MNEDLSVHSIEILKALYEKENEILQARLLEGELWEEVKEQKQKVIELSIALDKKLKALKGSNPAEFPSTDIEGR